MCRLRKWPLLLLVVLLVGTGGCQAFKEYSLTYNLWEKDPTASLKEQAQGGKYLYGAWPRATLTPLAVVGDATMVGLAVGAGCALSWFAEACEQGERNGGSPGF